MNAAPGAGFHLSKMLVREGDIVEKGQKVGFVGNTGLSTCSHLHLSTYVQGYPVDPLDVIRIMTANQ